MSFRSPPPRSATRGTKIKKTVEKTKTSQGSRVNRKQKVTPKVGTPQRSTTQARRTTSKSSAASSRTPGKKTSPGKPRKSPTKLSSSRFDKRKAGDPFANKSKQFKTNFARAYSTGGLPCRLTHGSVAHKLRWTVPLENVDYKLLVLVAEGLQETKHPYEFVARTAWKEMLEPPGVEDRVRVQLPHLLKPLRMALMTRDRSAFNNALKAIIILSNCVGPALNPHIKALLVQISKKAFMKAHRDSVTECLTVLGENGGPEVLPVIKAKVPTFQMLN